MSIPPTRIQPGPGQESVWDYPRPPRIDPCTKRVRVQFNGQLIADTERALRVLETSHPPTYYLPPEDVRTELLQLTTHRTFCEFKGMASYYTVRLGEAVARQAAWFYPDPTPRYAALRDYIAFYPSRMEGCWVGEERVCAQEGDFYGGWITSEIVGPFKGGRGTLGW